MSEIINTAEYTELNNAVQAIKRLFCCQPTKDAHIL